MSARGDGGDRGNRGDRGDRGDRDHMAREEGCQLQRRTQLAQLAQHPLVN